MAAITSTAVTDVRSWRTCFPGATLYHRLVDIVLTAQGGTANDIPASVLGFKKIYLAQSCGLVDAQSALHCVPVVVEADQEGILTVDVETAGDADRSNPANSANDGTLRVYVVGLENN